MASPPSSNLVLPPTVLIVDDEEGVRVLLRTWATVAGYAVRIAANVDVAIAVLNTHHCAAAVCDILMPGDRDGLWLIDHLLQHYPRMGIIIATGVDNMPPTLTLQSGI